MYTDYYHYKFNNDKELKLIKSNFGIEAQYLSDIYYSISLRQMRKIKIFAIEGNLKINKIIKKSKKVNSEDVLIAKLSFDLSAEIDKEILRSILKL